MDVLNSTSVLFLSSCTFPASRRVNGGRIDPQKQRGAKKENGGRAPRSRYSDRSPRHPTEMNRRGDEIGCAVSSSSVRERLARALSLSHSLSREGLIKSRGGGASCSFGAAA